MTTVRRDGESPNIYTVPFGRCDIQKSVNESKYEEIHHNVLIFPGESISKSTRLRYQKKRQFDYTLFLLHPPYSMNKSIRIYVFYHTWHQHCIISVINMSQNISSSAGKNFLLKSIIRVGCTSDVIFLWDITEKNKKRLNYCIE